MMSQDDPRNRIRLVPYVLADDENDSVRLVRWPEKHPLPRAGSLVMDYGREGVFAVGKDERGREYREVLRRSDFSNTLHWVGLDEDPNNEKLYPHLVLRVSDEPTLGEQDKWNDMLDDGGPDIDDLYGRAA